MKTRRIGRTALDVTEIGLGGASIAGLFRACPRDVAMATLEAAWNAGIRYFDTAPFYGFGLSERRLGDFLRDRPRGSWVLSTKVGRLLRPVPDGQVPDHAYVDPLPFDFDFAYGYDAIMRSVEFSHARLGLNRIDVLLVHDIGAMTHGVELTRTHLRQLLDGGVRALDELKSAGAIGAWGLGVNEVEICLEVMARVPLDCILLAGRHTLLDRSAEAALLPACRAAGTSLIVGGALNSGILASGPAPGATFNYRPAGDDVLARVAAMRRVAEDGGFPLAAAALQFPLREPAVASLLLGVGEPALLDANLGLLARDLPPGAFAGFEAHAIRP